MNSATLPSFWTTYRSLDEDIKRSARKAYRLWAENPFHPSLHFKRINAVLLVERIWSKKNWRVPCRVARTAVFLSDARPLSLSGQPDPSSQPGDRSVLSPDRSGNRYISAAGLLLPG